MKTVLLLSFVFSLLGFVGTLADGERSLVHAQSSPRCLDGAGPVCRTVRTETCERMVLRFSWARLFYIDCDNWNVRIQHYYWTQKRGAGGGNNGSDGDGISEVGPEDAG